MHATYPHNESFNLLNFIFWIPLCKSLNETVAFGVGEKTLKIILKGGGWLCYWYNNSRAILTKLWTFGLSKSHVLTSFKISLRWHQFPLIINFLSVCMTCFVSLKKHFMCTYSVLMYIKNWMQFVKDCCNYYSNDFIIIFVSASLQLYLVTFHTSLSQGPWSFINYSVFYTCTCTSNTLI